MASDPKAVKKPVKPFAQAKKVGKSVTSKQAALVANLMKFHKQHVAPLMTDAEDLQDGGADEAEEQD